MVWVFNVDGVGAITNDGGNIGTGKYNAQDTPGDVTLGLMVWSGPSANQVFSVNRTVVPPIGTRMTLKNSNSVRHVSGFAGAGIALYYWLDPKDVSFSKLTFGEGAVAASNPSGFYLKCEPWQAGAAPNNAYPNGTAKGGHTHNTFGVILTGNIDTGCRVSVNDLADTGDWNPYAAGSLTWAMPTQYIQADGTRVSFGNSPNQVMTLQDNGSATVSKGLQSGSANLNDQNHGY